MQRSGLQTRWLQRQRSDPFSLQARQRHLRSRAWFKLEELDKKYPLFGVEGAVLDLGSSPGGWSQYLASRKPKLQKIVACDLLPMPPISGVHFLQGDFTSALFQEALRQALRGLPLRAVISDMAPNLSGNADQDQGAMAELIWAVQTFAQVNLATGGHVLCKAFQGSEFRPLQEALRRRFSKVLVHKPKASRAGSREVYLLGLGHQSA